MKTLTRLAATAATAALTAAVAGPAAGAQAPAHPRVVRVSHVPDAPRGDDPRVAYVDTDADVIRSGDREAALLEDDYPPAATRAAGPGRWVFTGPDGLYVAEVGEQPRLLAPHGGAGFQVDGPAHARVAALEQRRGTTRIVVRRLSDGHVVAVTRTVGDYTGILAFKQGKVWFRKGHRVAVWDVAADRVRLRAPLRPSGTMALDVGAGGAVRQVEGVDEVYPLRKDATWKPWRTTASRVPIGWSPDGRYLAFGTHGNRFENYTDISIFNATSGRLVRTFLASGRLPFRPDSVRWETPTALLVRTVTHDGAYHESNALVRLYVGGRFERASEVDFNRLSPVMPSTSVTNSPY